MLLGRAECTAIGGAPAKARRSQSRVRRIDQSLGPCHGRNWLRSRGAWAVINANLTCNEGGRSDSRISYHFRADLRGCRHNSLLARMALLPVILVPDDRDWNLSNQARPPAIG